MEINKFVSRFNNHPILFVGTGMSLRYLKHSFTWDALLRHISFELTGNNEKYLDLKAKHYKNSKYNYDEIATTLEVDFNVTLEKDRNGKFKEINDEFYKNMENEINISRFKIYLSKLFDNIEISSDMSDEIVEFKKVRKNIGSVITTNYDKFIETVFDFNPLIGNDILLSNPYGSVYKIHGCVSSADKIIITSEDYNKFEQKYELIRAQLLSLFIHNPIVFMGYSIGDENIRSILKTIFTYVPSDSHLAEKIKSNFLLVEYEKESLSNDVYEHDININEFTTIRVNKIKTDNFIEIYKAFASMQLSVSAMDVRKVQNVVKQIYEGGSIKVSITEDIDDLSNDNKVLAIGTLKTINYVYQTTAEMMVNYFNIIEEENVQLLELINKQTIQSSQYFPVYAFSKINPNIEKANRLKQNQKSKIDDFLENVHENCKTAHLSIYEIISDGTVSKSNEINSITYAILESQINLIEVEEYLKNFSDKKSTNYRKILCAYDYMKYNN